MSQFALSAPIGGTIPRFSAVVVLLVGGIMVMKPAPASGKKQSESRITICVAAPKSVGLDADTTAVASAAIIKELRSLKIRTLSLEKRQCRGRHQGTLKIVIIRGGPVVRLTYRLLDREDNTELYHSEISMDAVLFPGENLLPTDLFDSLDSLRPSPAGSESLVVIPAESGSSPGHGEHNPGRNQSADSSEGGGLATSVRESHGVSDGSDEGFDTTFWGWVAIAGGGALLAGGGYTTILFLVEKSRLDDIEARHDKDNNKPPVPNNEAEANGDMGLTADLLTIGGVLIAGAGILMLTVFDDDETESSDVASLQPWVGPQSAGATVTYRF